MGSSAGTIINLNDSNPSPPAGAANVRWQGSPPYTGSSGYPQRDVSANLAPFTGDAGSGGGAGIVPAPAAGDASAGKYLKADGTWAKPAGGTGTGGAVPIIVQQAYGRSATNTTTPVNATLASNPTPGNLLVLMMTGQHAGGVTAPGLTGWTQLCNDVINTYEQAGIWLKVAAAGDGKTWGVSISAPNGGTNVALFEIAGAAGYTFSDGAGILLAAATVAVNLTNLPGPSPGLVFAFLQEDGSIAYSSFASQSGAFSVLQQFNASSPITNTTNHFATLLYATSASAPDSPSVTWASGIAYPAFCSLALFGPAGSGTGGGGGTGTVTSVALAAPAEFTVSGSPVTAAGTLTLAKANESANQVWAGPASGAAAAPAFRALVAGDIPNIAESQVTNLVTDLAAKAPTARQILTTAPLTGGGDLTADRTLAVSTMTGDAGSGGARGVVPAPAAGDADFGRFLKADGNWRTPFEGVTLISSNYTVLTTDNNSLLVMNTSGAATVTLPNPPPSPYWLVHIENPLPGTLSVSPNGLLLDGAAGNLNVGKNQGVMVATDGTNYYSQRGMATGGGGGGGTGTVTSVALTMPAEFAVTGSPITGFGTLAVTSNTETANTVWAGPASGAAAAPAFRTLVAGDIPNIAENQVTNLPADLAAKAPLTSPVFTGTPQGPIFWAPITLAANLVAPADCGGHHAGRLIVPAGVLVDLSAGTGQTLLEVF